MTCHGTPIRVVLPIMAGLGLVSGVIGGLLLNFLPDIRRGQLSGRRRIAPASQPRLPAAGPSQHAAVGCGLALGAHYGDWDLTKRRRVKARA
jgi:hypothetical protein